MTFTQLEYLIAVAEHQNFTLAAAHCSVTQPTLSMQIQKLEASLDVQIFDRSKKPVSLTETGKKIYFQAKTILAESRRIKDIVDRQKGYIGGEFKLAIIPTVMPTLLPIFLDSFSKKYPEVELKIDELPTEECIKKLEKGDIDAAIVATPLENENLVEQPLYYEPFVGFVPKSHKLHSKKRLSTASLKTDELLLLKEGHCFKQSVLNICSSLQSVAQQRFQLQSGSFDTLIKLTKEGLGMTLLPYLHTLDLTSEDRELLREFEKPVPAREISLIHHKSQLKMHLIEILKKTIDGLIRGAIAFDNVDIVSPLKKKKNAFNQ